MLSSCVSIVRRSQSIGFLQRTPMGAAKPNFLPASGIDENDGNNLQLRSGSTVRVTQLSKQWKPRTARAML